MYGQPYGKFPYGAFWLPSSSGAAAPPFVPDWSQEAEVPQEPTGWVGRPNAVSIALLTSPAAVPPPGHALKRFDWAEQSIWFGFPVDSAPLQLLTAQKFYAAGGQALAKLWRYDHVADPVWTWQSPSSAVLAWLLTAAGEPKQARWNFGYDDAQAWRQAPFYNLNLFGQSAAVTPKQQARWNFGYDDAQAWRAAPFYNLNLFGQAAPATPKQQARWNFGYDDAQTWRVAPSYNLNLFGQSAAVTPKAARVWHYDYQIEFPQWQGSPSGAAPIVILTAQKVFDAGGQVPAKTWRYDYPFEGPWTWRAPASAVLADLLTDLGPVHAARWRHDLAEVSSWMFTPQVRFLSPAAPFVTSSWRREAIEGPYWAWHAVTPIGVILSTPKSPTPIAGSFWWPAPVQDVFWPCGSDAAAILINSLLIVGEREPLAARYIRGRSGPKRIVGRSGFFIKGRP